MGSQVVIDIETIPNIDVIDLLPEPQPDSRLKDPIKVAADIEKKKEKATGGMSLDPNFGRVCVIGYADRRNGEITSRDHWLAEATDAAEQELLSAFWESVREYQKVITFNGAGFDIPFLLRRSWLLDVKPSRVFEVVLWKCATGEANHIDLRLVLSNGNAKAKGTMDLFGKLKLGKGKMDGMDGSQVWPAWQEGRIEEVRAYCREDCVRTLELLESLYGYYLPEVTQ